MPMRMCAGVPRTRGVEQQKQGPLGRNLSPGLGSFCCNGMVRPVTLRLRRCSRRIDGPAPATSFQASGCGVGARGRATELRETACLRERRSVVQR